MGESGAESGVLTALHMQYLKSGSAPGDHTPCNVDVCCYKVRAHAALQPLRYLSIAFYTGSSFQED